MKVFRHVKAEPDNLQIQLGNKAYLTLDDYAQLYGAKRHNASRHLSRRQIPFSKKGNDLCISVLDLAIYKVKNKAAFGAPLARPYENGKDEIKRRR